MPIPENEHLASFSLNQRELFRRVGWLVDLRWAAIGCALAGVFIVCLVYGLIEGVPIILLLTGIAFAYNLIFTVIRRRVHAVPARWKNIAFAWLQITADLGMLTAVVHFTGGIHSIFVVFYMVHLVIAAELLRRWHSFAIAALASILLNLVVYLENAGFLERYWIPGLAFGFSEDAEAAELPGVMCLIYNGAFFLIAHVASSISSRLRKSEREIERINRQLSAINAKKSAFMRMTGHEMRAPLNAIMGLLHLIEKKTYDGALPSEISILIARSRQRIHAMADLIRDLLEYSRLQTAEVLEKKRRVNLRALVNETIEEFMPVAEEKKIALRVDARECETQGDEDQIQALVRNLVSNALRYTPVSGAVEISLTPDGNRAVFCVKDSGIGISEDSMEHIFDEFFRAPEAKNHEPGGTGLGLTLCKAIVERHGGDIRVESKPGEGSVFTVRFLLSAAA